ncbi:MAG: HAMP domain-containing sensor histidine kinase, partial [Calditrichia bacterium]
VISAVVVIIGIILAFWQSRAVTRPLNELALAAGNISLEKLNVRFWVKNNNDEVGLLATAMQQMVRRLRLSRRALARAEQKAAHAEIARQVNHDIKNGFIPIRNVMTHWSEVAEKEPEKLVKIFRERKDTILESVAYLESLAHSYLRLQPAKNVRVVKVNDVIRQLLDQYEDYPEKNIHFITELTPQNPEVQADPLQLRRALENLLRNAIDAIGESGEIHFHSGLRKNQVQISVTDNGSGIAQEVMDKLFTQNISTKPEGSGMGLMNVKRIIEDIGGRVTVEKNPAGGTTIHLNLPAHSRRAGETHA